MAASRHEIQGWLQRGKDQGATHVIVVCDTYDYEDYPIFVFPQEDPYEVEKKYSGQNMQRVMEVYALHLDWETQLSEHRSFHYEKP